MHKPGTGSTVHQSSLMLLEAVLPLSYDENKLKSSSYIDFRTKFQYNELKSVANDHCVNNLV